MPSALQKPNSERVPFLSLSAPLSRRWFITYTTLASLFLFGFYSCVSHWLSSTSDTLGTWIGVLVFAGSITIGVEVLGVLWLMRRATTLIGNPLGKVAGLLLSSGVLFSPLLGLYHYMFLAFAPEAQGRTALAKRRRKSRWIQQYVFGLVLFHTIFLVSKGPSTDGWISLNCLDYLPLTIKYIYQTRVQVNEIMKIKADLDQMSSQSSFLETYRSRNDAIESAIRQYSGTKGFNTTGKILLMSLSVMTQMQRKVAMNEVEGEKSELDREISQTSLVLDMLEQIVKINVDIQEQPLWKRVSPLGVTYLSGSLELILLYGVDSRLRMIFDRQFDSKLLELTSKVDSTITQLKESGRRNEQSLEFQRRLEKVTQKISDHEQATVPTLWPKIL